jgi:hypothetical protein
MRRFGRGIRSGLSEATIGLAMPVALPLWLELSGPLLLGFGLASRRHKVKRRRAERMGRAKKKRAPRKPVKRLGNVAQFRKASATNVVPLRPRKGLKLH